jgi:hypothetical protein
VGISLNEKQFLTDVRCVFFYTSDETVPILIGTVSRDFLIQNFFYESSSRKQLIITSQVNTIFPHVTLVILIPAVSTTLLANCHWYQWEQYQTTSTLK